MNGRVYYNDNDAFCCAWLGELMRDGLIPTGEIDNRSITDVRGSDLAGFEQCHFFAGIAGWPRALQLAQWQGPVWTASCPCQPLSSAGQRKGHADERHLWPAFYSLVSECGPAICFGEQVASKLGREWLAGIRADLEALGYGVGAADLCAASASAPHIRQRLYWVADSDSGGERRQSGSERHAPRESESQVGQQNGKRLRDIAVRTSAADIPRLADSMRAERRAPTEGRQHVAHGPNTRREEAASRSEFHSETFARLGDSDSGHGHWWSGPVQVGRNGIEGEIERGGRKHRAQWRVGPGIRIVADGIPNRVGALCGAGNAIVPQVAAQFVKAYVETQSAMKRAA